MNINELIKKIENPGLYEKGTSQMWTDDHISKLLLDVHLNKEIDLASRKESTIDSTINWILSKTGKEKLNILDLGCGPGLYTEKLAAKGHTVTGVDFSKHSIEYARSEAEKKSLNINYINENYLNLNLEENQFDLVIMIFTDFGVLLPDERKCLINIIDNVLKPDGRLIFDAMNDKNLEDKIAPKNWEVTESGFWKDQPYIGLSESFFYKENKVVLFQHIIIDQNDNTEIYRFWTHFFSDNDLRNELKGYSFKSLSFFDDVLPAGDTWSGDNVTFCVAEKLKSNTN
ncbi:MAG: methyltransferase domain-containing protein [Melioribacteraceae bacterium]|nr:methyltransferase domain-containing protein [Melioribacteraceae bacterium]